MKPVFEKGKLEIVRIGGMTLGRASYEPGWRWSEHVSPIAGTPLDQEMDALHGVARYRHLALCVLRPAIPLIAGPALSGRIRDDNGHYSRRRHPFAGLPWL